MSAQPVWLTTFLWIASSSLVAAVYVAGLVVTLRRWHLGMAPRLGAIGFGLLLAGSVLQLLFHAVLQRFLNPSDSSTFVVRLAVASSIFTLLSVTGLGLIVVALRTALRDYERAQNATPVP